MITQSAFVNKERKMLKGALHSHTTRSDGPCSPEELIILHESMGYDFLALTDHRLYNLKNYRESSNLTIIPGIEIDALGRTDAGLYCYHTVCIGPEKDNGFAHDENFNTFFVTCQEDFQPALDRAHENGNLTFYCHPEWSGTSTGDFDKLKGNFAMEIWNSGCVLENEMDTNAAYWDEILSQGQRLFGVAVDDGHHLNHVGKGFVRVNAENDVDAILGALRDGAFYSSCGPVIYDFGIEDDEVYLKCSPAAKIFLKCYRFPSILIDGEDGPITEARRQIPLDRFPYVRAVVIDEQGRRAWTNPIFLN